MATRNGELVWNLRINDAGARSTVSEFKRELRATDREIQNTYRSEMQQGRVHDAMAHKLKNEIALNKRRLDGMRRIQEMLDRSSEDKSTLKYNRTETDLQNLSNSYDKTKTSIDNLTRSVTLHSDAMYKADNKLDHVKQTVGDTVEKYRLLGDATKENEAKTQGYSNIISSLDNKIKSYKNSLQDYIDKSKENHEAIDTESKDYLAVKEGITAATNAKIRYQQVERDMISGLTPNKQFDSVYDQNTNKVISSLKRMKQQTQANRYEYNRLISNQKREVETLQLEANKADDVAKKSGTDSIAFQNEGSRLASLQSKYAEHINRINVLSSTYGRMSSRVAQSVDNQRLKIRRLDLESHRQLTTAHSLTNGSIALGAGFLYGAKQAMGLENEFNKIRNLLNTSGESYRQSTEDIHKMGDAAEKYSIQYGVSQNEISKGYEDLVRRGYSGNQALASQKSYLQGAIASGDEYSDVMNTAASTLEAFGMRTNNTNEMVGNTKTAVNQLAMSADMTASDFRGIAYGMRFTGATAHSANQSLSETASALGELSNNGETATNAGFGLRKVLNSFIGAKDTKKWKKILPQLGLSTKDFQTPEGHFKKLSTMMDILYSHMQGRTDAQKSDLFHQLFGATGQESAINLADNTGNLEKLNAQVARAQKQNHGQGYIARIAQKNMNSTQNQMKRLQMAGQALAKDYAQGLNPAFKRLAVVGLDASKGFGKLPKPMKDAVAIGTTLVPMITGANYIMSAYNKTLSYGSSVRLKMMGIDKNEQEELKAKIGTTDLYTEANNRNNLSVTEAIRLHRQKMVIDQEETKSDDENTEEKDRNTTAQDENTGAIDRNTQANDSNAESELSNTENTLSERHATLGKWNNLTGGSIGTGFMGKAIRRYGAAGLGMGTLIGGTEAANGDVRNGAADGLGTAGGTVLGGVIAGPIGSMIGGIAGPMIARKINSALDHPYVVGKNMSASSKEDRSVGRQLDKDLKHINSNDKSFVKKEANLDTKATDEFAENGGKMTKSIRKTANDMYTVAQSYGKKQITAEDNWLSLAAHEGRITNSQYASGAQHLASSESNVLSSISYYESMAVSGTKLTTSQREDYLSKADSEELKLTGTAGSKQNHLLSDLNKRTSSLTTKSYSAVLSQGTSNYKATNASASFHYKNEMQSVKGEYAAMEKAGLIHRSNASSAVKSLEKVYSSERSDTLSKANNTSVNVSKAASQMADNTTKKHYQASNSVSSTNSKAASQNTSVAAENSKAWSHMASNATVDFNYAMHDAIVGISTLKEIFGIVGNHKNFDKKHPHIAWYTKLWNKLRRITTVSDPGMPFQSHALGTFDAQHVVINNPVTEAMSNHANGSYDTAALHFAGGVLPGIQKTENAVINDGNGPELVKLPNGQFILPNGSNVHTILPKGTSVFNADQTRKILGMINRPSVHHAGGTVNDKFGIQNSIKVKMPNGTFKDTEKNTKKSMKNIHDVINKGYKKANEAAQSHLQDLHDGSDDSWNDTEDLTKQHVKNIHDDTSDQYKDLKNNVSRLQSRSNQNTSSQLDIMVRYFRNHFSMISPISRTSMQSGIKNINSGIAAIDSVLKQFGGNSHVLNTVHFASGTTRPFMDKQLAILNDATAGPQQEAIVSDQGRVRLPVGRNAVTMLDPGDKVLNGSDTLRAIKTGLIPHYSNGKDSHDTLLKMIKQYSKRPTSFTNGTFTKFASIMGNTLSEGVITSSKQGSKGPANNWSKAMWEFISSLVYGNGSSSEFLNYAEKLGHDAKGYSEDLGLRMGPSYYDCSSLVWNALRHFGISIPGGTTVVPIMRYFANHRIPLRDAQPGDLVGSNDHIGIIADHGGHHYYSAQSPSSGIRMSPLVPSAFPDGWIHVERVPQLTHHDQSVNVNKHSLTPLVKRQLGNNAIKWIKDELDDSELGNPLGIGVNRWIPIIKKAAERMHADISNGGLAKVLTTIRHESQGNPTVTQHGYCDINTGGNEAVGLVQFAKHTFPTYSLSGHGNRRNGYDELLALFNDSNWRSDLMPFGGWNPSGRARYSKVPGYMSGGLTVTDKLAHISEGNQPEMILPLTNKSRAVELMLKSLHFMFGNDQNGGKGNDTQHTSSSDREFERELIQSNQQKDLEIKTLTDTTNKILNKMTILIRTVQNKPVISDVDIYNANRKQSLKNLRLRNLNRGAF